jgi:hypothetical protein
LEGKLELEPASLYLVEISSRLRKISPPLPIDDPDSLKHVQRSINQKLRVESYPGRVIVEDLDRQMGINENPYLAHWRNPEILVSSAPELVGAPRRLSMPNPRLLRAIYSREPMGYTARLKPMQAEAFYPNFIVVQPRSGTPELNGIDLVVQLIVTPTQERLQRPQRMLDI